MDDPGEDEIERRRDGLGAASIACAVLSSAPFFLALVGSVACRGVGAVEDGMGLAICGTFLGGPLWIVALVLAAMSHRSRAGAACLLYPLAFVLLALPAAL